MKKILITGGLGHIGSYLAKELSDRNVITIVDNFLTNRYCSLFNFEYPVTFIENSFEKLDVEFLKQFDVVYHSAAITDAAGSFSNVEQIEKINVEYTKILIDNCIQANVHFIFPSSTSVYGTSAELVNEDKKYINPQSPYAESKVKIEEYLEQNSNNYTIFRFGTIHGVSNGMRFHTAINKFCYQSALNIPLTIWKENYDMYRPYLILIDAKNAIELAINKLPKKSIFNVLSDNHRLRNIVNLIDLYSKNKISINWVNTPLLNQYSYKVSSLEIQTLGYTPSVNSINYDIRETLYLLRNLK